MSLKRIVYFLTPNDPRLSCSCFTYFSHIFQQALLPPQVSYGANHPSNSISAVSPSSTSPSHADLEPRCKDVTADHFINRRCLPATPPDSCSHANSAQKQSTLFAAPVSWAAASSSFASSSSHSASALVPTSTCASCSVSSPSLTSVGLPSRRISRPDTTPSASWRHDSVQVRPKPTSRLTGLPSWRLSGQEMPEADGSGKKKKGADASRAFRCLSLHRQSSRSEEGFGGQGSPGDASTTADCTCSPTGCQPVSRSEWWPPQKRPPRQSSERQQQALSQPPTQRLICGRDGIASRHFVAPLTPWPVSLAAGRVGYGLIEMLKGIHFARKHYSILLQASIWREVFSVQFLPSNLRESFAF
ncbi:unnamed protein product [Protopolystoma xenopodis]|uniref:Uncharacterized protein n=1 Tax=Protopolystoma xenopodis TaxID=117903 RepID=A0A3S5FH57_9PLAT|nr:unnamed protein product [Protopolystoma xenopodis]